MYVPSVLFVHVCVQTLNTTIATHKGSTGTGTSLRSNQFEVLPSTFVCFVRGCFGVNNKKYTHRHIVVVVASYRTKINISLSFTVYCTLMYLVLFTTYVFKK